MSTNHIQGVGGNNNNPAGSRREREARFQSPTTFNGTGALPPVNTGRSYAGSFDFEGLLVSLRDQFARDRQLASQQDNKRCGICYLYFSSEELHYREEEGFYICPGCERALGKQTLPMIRRQQK